MRRPLVNALAAYLTLAWLVSGCTEPPGQPEDASSLDASSDADASLPLPDAMSDARVLPIVTQHDFCALPWFKLPVDGPSEETTGIRLADQHVVYSRSHFNQGIGTKELHLLNLETCIDAQQTSGARVWAPFKRNFEVVWEDFASPTPQSGVGCSDLVLLDLQSQRMHTVPLTTGFENSPVLTENLAFFLAS
ncbi:MAG: hypothetical protein RBU30_27480, partial [Polyangia bacterium]|nr:hypothetical protein [Polyangia bacterium]